MRWKPKKIEPRPPTYWEPVFALLPVTLENTGERVWLERVWMHEEIGYGGMGDRVLMKPRRYRDDIGWHCANLSFEDRK